MNKISKLMKEYKEKQIANIVNKRVETRYSYIHSERLRNNGIKFYIGVNEENKNSYIIPAVSYGKAVEVLRMEEKVAPLSENIHVPFEIVFPHFSGKIDDEEVLDNSLSAIKLRATKCGPYDFGYYDELLLMEVWPNILSVLYEYGITTIICDKYNVIYYTTLAVNYGILEYKDKNEYNPYGCFEISLNN